MILSRCSWLYHKSGDLEAAKKEFETAIAMEDSLTRARLGLIAVGAAAEDFAVSVAQLGERTARGLATEEEIETLQDDPGYEAIFESPEYKE
jgi:hypothetical protein